MKFENNYVYICLKNHEYISREIALKKMDLYEKKKSLISKYGIGGMYYGERIDSNILSNPTCEMVIWLDEKTKEIDQRLSNLDEELNALNRVIIIFERLVSIMPKHYHVVDQMIYSGDVKYGCLMKQMMLGFKTISTMRENTILLIGEIASCSYSNDELLSMDITDFARLIRKDLYEIIILHENRGL